MTDPRAKADATRALKHVQDAGGTLRFYDELDAYAEMRPADGIILDNVAEARKS